MVAVGRDHAGRLVEPAAAARWRSAITLHVLAAAAALAGPVGL
jgi:hypothetical protein